jgi:hypothetical protein
MAQDDDPTRGSAPDLQILGDQITLQPRSYVDARGEEDHEEALMKNMARFRAEPLQYVAPPLHGFGLCAEEERR